MEPCTDQMRSILEPQMAQALPVMLLLMMMKPIGMEEADYYRSPAQEITRDTERLTALESELAAAYDRWQKLEAEREAGK